MQKMFLTMAAAGMLLGSTGIASAAEGRIKQRASLPMATGSWAACVESVNTLIADLVQALDTL